MPVLSCPVLSTPVLPCRVVSSPSHCAGTGAGAAMHCSRCQRIQAFVILFSVAIALMALAVIVFLPMILFAPAKFALCFTTGSLCFMAAFASFSGPATFARGLFAKDRVWFAVAYVGSLCTCGETRFLSPPPPPPPPPLVCRAVVVGARPPPLQPPKPWID